MKIRHGFVSNSSSSSFMIYGVLLDEDELKKLLDFDEDKEDFDGFYEVVENKLANTGLEYHNPDGYEGWYIGASWDSIEDEETGKQFKKRVAKSIEKVLGKKLDCETYSESYYS